MNILVITDLYPIKKQEKYTPRTIFDFVQGWEAIGHNVKVIKPNFILNSFLRKKPYYKNGEYGDVLNLNYWLPFMGNIHNKFKDINIFTENTIVIAHMPSGLIFASKLDIPFVAGVHVSDIEVLTNPIYSIYFKSELRKAYEKAVKIACRSMMLKKKFLEIFPQYEKKVFVAYSGIDSKIILKKDWQRKEKYKILTCANLIKRKNIDKVIQACDCINNTELTVIGDGDEFNNLKKISSKVTFTGHLPNEQVLAHMRNSDIFILPSVKETFGVVYLEAMASGCVTIGLEKDGIDGIIIDGHNGYLAKLDNIKETLEKVVNTDNSTILKNSYETILDYTKEKACANYLANII